MTATPVDVDNFVRAETDLMFARLAASAGGTNRWTHRRLPAAIDDQVVVRLNRDTLYSFAVVDLAEGATVTLPDAAGRYLSVMVVSRDHHVTSILHDPGSYPLSVEEAGTRWVALAARVLADAGDPADIGVAHRVQDGLQLQAGSTAPFEPPSYDTVSQYAVRSALKELARDSVDFQRSFGAADEVDPVRHLIGIAVGWGVSRSARRSTSGSSRGGQSAPTGSRSTRSPSTGSGRSRSTTPMATSNRTPVTRTASTA